LTNESKEKPEPKFNAAFGTTFKISKCFQGSRQKYFSIEQSRLKIQKPFGHVMKVLI
jgi:hypothetical protein